MAIIIKKLVPHADVSDRGGALETVAREALSGLDDEDLTVSFNTWDDGSVLQFVCKVETPPGDPLGSPPPWRWWSPLCATADELRVHLTAMVARRYGRRDEGAAAGDAGLGAESAAAS